MKYQNHIAEEIIPVVEALKKQAVPPGGMALQEIFRTAQKQKAKQFRVSSTVELRVENKYFSNSDGQQTQLRVFTPLRNDAPKPLLYWIHGGGTISGLPEQEDTMLYKLALDLNCVITSINYRLAPENPYPKPLNDCYEGLVHAVQNASEFGINSNKVVVGGGSAGGLLTTSVAIKARDEDGPEILLQVLLYPMLDSTCKSESHKVVPDLGVWDSAANHYAFQCYLGDLPESDYEEAIPAMVEDLSKLPDAFVVVGTMDCLRDESIEYAQRLAAAGAKVELHIYPGMVHAFDGLAPNAEASKDLWKTRVSAIKRAFDQ